MFISLCMAQGPEGDGRGIPGGDKGSSFPQEPTYLGFDRQRYAQKGVVGMAYLYGEVGGGGRGGN